MRRRIANIEQRIYRHLAIYSKPGSRKQLRLQSAIYSPASRELGLRGDLFGPASPKASDANSDHAIVYAVHAPITRGDFFAMKAE
jgi:hypothetical protein